MKEEMNIEEDKNITSYFLVLAEREV